MSDWQAGRWLGWDGRWREGAPPNGWWQSADGRWHAPDAPASRPHANPAPPGGAYLDPAYLNEPDRSRPADGPYAGNGHAGSYADEHYRSDDSERADDDGRYSFGYSYADAHPDDEAPTGPATHGTADHTSPAYGTDRDGSVGSRPANSPAGYGTPPDQPADDLPRTWQVPSQPSPPPYGLRPAADDGMPSTGAKGPLGNFATWPTWARIGVPAAAGLVLLALLSVAFGDPESDNTAASGSTSTTAIADPTTTAVPATQPSTTAPPPTTAPPTTPPTTAPTTTTTTAPPPPPPPPPPTTATPAPPVASGCHPSYTGACVPANASDVDCAGGSGDGPEYVQGPLQVVGPDVYDLDGNDDDGIACE